MTRDPSAYVPKGLLNSLEDIELPAPLYLNSKLRNIMKRLSNMEG